MSMTTTRTVDEYGNVIYLVRDGDREFGKLYKRSGGYLAELVTGGSVAVSSLKKGVAWLERWSR